MLEDSYQWKWVIMALDSTIQNAMAMTIRDTAGINVLQPSIQKEFAEALRDGTLRPIERLDSFLGLYKSTKGNEMTHFIGSKPYVPEGTEEQSIKKIHSLKNRFSHFIPMGYFMRLDRYPNIVLDCMEFVSFLTNSFNFSFMLKNEQERKIKFYILRIRKSCKKINETYKPLVEAEKKHYEKLRKMQEK